MLACSACGLAFAQSNDAARERISRADLEACVKQLASDEWRGRRTGAPEAVAAARWLADGLARAGVAPAGDAGTFLQRVPMHEVARKAAPKLLAHTRDGRTVELAYGVDFDQAEVLADARIERIVVVAKKDDLPDAPSTSIALVLPESRSERRALLEAAGAPEGAGFGLILTLGPDTPGKERDVSGGNPSLRVDRGAEAGQRLRLRGSAKQRLVAGEFTGFELVANVERKVVDAFNVVGVVRGTGVVRDAGPKAAEAIVVSAHYDHLGVDTRAPSSSKSTESTDTHGEPPDVIYNGADDDASGCAVVLELADALAHAPRVDRTVIFFFATGEELGLLGTNWYVERPFVPLDDTVLNLNFEMLGRPDAKAGGPGKLWLTGDERTNLGAAFRARGLAIVADPRPDQNFFERSDNMAFVRKGIVGQSLSTYDLHTDYHRVSDEWDTLDYAHLETCARTSFDALLLVADDAFVPAWTPGDEYAR
ncbi:MAG: M28 family peptidase [Planctomycetes bacterium]|nr:M28 family peptidase [Planctomycetota bacterium]